MRTLIVALAVGTFLLAGASAQAGVDPQDACKDSKAKTTGKKAADLLKAYGKNIKKSDPTKLSASVSKAQSKFTKGFNKAESKSGCQTTGDSGAIELKVDAFVFDVVEEINPQSSPSGGFLDVTGGAID
jgi:hypothetical protein